MKAIDSEQDWPEGVYIFGIQIVPDLPVAIKGSSAVDVDIISSKLEEGGHVLEDEGEGMGLPVSCII